MDPADLRCLTLHPIWADAIARGPKRVENRSWRPPAGTTWIAIHAGAKDPLESVGLAKSLGWSGEGRATSAVVALVRIGEIVERSDDPWFMGPLGWTLVDVRRIEPIPAVGGLGLWRPDADALTLLTKHL